MQGWEGKERSVGIGGEKLGAEMEGRLARCRDGRGGERSWVQGGKGVGAGFRDGREIWEAPASKIQLNFGHCPRGVGPN